MTPFRRRADCEDAGEAAAVIKNLATPHFGHEAVYRGLQLGLEANPKPPAVVVSLLRGLKAGDSATPYQMSLGFERARVRLDDWVLDAPGVKAAFGAVVKACVAEHLLPASWDGVA